MRTLSSSLVPFSLVFVTALLVACSDDGAAGDDDGSSSGGSSSSESSSSSGGASSSSGGSSGASSSGSSSGASSGSSSGNLPGSSQGTGGVECTSEAALDGDPAPNRRYCLASEAGAEFKLVLPQTQNGPYNVGLYLHGDGAGAYNSDSAMETLLGWADTHNTILVSVRAPNTCSWWLRPEYTCPENGSVDVQQDRDWSNANADALDAVLKKLRARYDISNGPLFYYGSSGGSIFLTYSFFAKYGNVYPGAFALNCGGEVPEEETIAWNLDDAAQRGSTKMWFTYGDQDEVLPPAQVAATAEFFTGHGFPVNENVIAGAGHCEFDGHGRAKEVWSEFLGEAP